MSPKVSIIVLTWNNSVDTIKCLNSLQRLSYTNYEILLVDNGSKSHFVNEIKKNFPQINIIINQENLGYAKGNNVGIQAALANKADYILLLNNDTVVDRSFVEPMIGAMEKDKQIGIVGSKIYYLNEPNKIWSAGGEIDFKNMEGRHIGLNEEDKGQYSQSKKVEYVSGCSMMIKSKVFNDIGLLPQEYFLYFEDTDICLAASKKEWKIKYVPESKVWHNESTTSVQGSPLVEYYLTRNHLIFARKYLNKRQFIIFINYFIWKNIKKSIKLLLKFKINNILAIFKGCFDYFAGKKGKK